MPLAVTSEVPPERPGEPDCPVSTVLNELVVYKVVFSVLHVLLLC